MMMASKCMDGPLLFDLFKPWGRVDALCAPASGRNIIVAGLPVIHYFYAATDSENGATIVVEPGEAIVLRWNLENADSVRLAELTATGSEIATETIDVSASWFDLARPTHTDFDLRSYRLQATNFCQYTDAIVTIIGSKRPRLAIQRIEVTQGIQTLDADVKLVAGKPTVVRTYITHALDGFGDNKVPLVKGSLSVYSNGTYKGFFYPVNGVPPAPPDPPAPDIDASITVFDLGDPPPPGHFQDHTLNFVIPASLCTGTLDLRVSVRVDSFGPPDQPGFSDSANFAEDDFVFHQRKPVKLRYIPVFITQELAASVTFLGVANPPTEQECANFLRDMMKLLPITASSIERLDGWSIIIGVGQIVMNSRGSSIVIPGFRGTGSLEYDVEGDVFTLLLGTLRLCELASSAGVCAEDHDAIWAVLVPIDGLGTGELDTRTRVHCSILRHALRPRTGTLSEPATSRKHRLRRRGEPANWIRCNRRRGQLGRFRWGTDLGSQGGSL